MDKFDQERAEAQLEDKRDEYERRIAELEQAIKVVVEKFERSESDGYRSRDRQYAIEILRKAVPVQNPSEAPVSCPIHGRKRG